MSSHETSFLQKGLLGQGFWFSAILHNELTGETSVCGILNDSLVHTVPEMQIAEFANNVDLDEVAHNDPPHLDLHCLPASL